MSKSVLCTPEYDIGMIVSGARMQTSRMCFRNIIIIIVDIYQARAADSRCLLTCVDIRTCVLDPGMTPHRLVQMQNYLAAVILMILFRGLSSISSQPDDVVLLLHG